MKANKQEGTRMIDRAGVNSCGGYMLRVRGHYESPLCQSPGLGESREHCSRNVRLSYHTSHLLHLLGSPNLLKPSSQNVMANGLSALSLRAS